MVMNTSNHTGPHCFNMPAWISCAPFEQMLGMEIVKAEGGEAILRMPFIQSLAQGAGLMHGGAMVSLADTAVVMAIKSMVLPGTHFATLSMENRFLHPVKQGTLEAKASVAERDGSLIKGSCEIFDQEDRKVMIFESVFKIARDAKIKDIVYETA
jgi:acyl-CoA thioesterase